MTRIRAISGMLSGVREDLQMGRRKDGVMLGSHRSASHTLSSYASRTHIRIIGFHNRICEASCGARILDWKTHAICGTCQKNIPSRGNRIGVRQAIKRYF